MNRKTNETYKIRPVVDKLVTKFQQMPDDIDTRALALDYMIFAIEWERRLLQHEKNQENNVTKSRMTSLLEACEQMHDDVHQKMKEGKERTE